jgi:hypothetical protein
MFIDVSPRLKSDPTYIKGIFDMIYDGSYKSNHSHSNEGFALPLGGGFEQISDSSSASYFNEIEAEVATDIIHCLLDHFDADGDHQTNPIETIGVISPYSAQVRLLTEKFRQLGWMETSPLVVMNSNDDEEKPTPFASESDSTKTVFSYDGEIGDAGGERLESDYHKERRMRKLANAKKKRAKLLSDDREDALDMEERDQERMDENANGWEAQIDASVASRKAESIGSLVFDNAMMGSEGIDKDEDDGADDDDMESSEDLNATSDVIESNDDELDYDQLVIEASGSAYSNDKPEDQEDGDDDDSNIIESEGELKVIDSIVTLIHMFHQARGLAGLKFVQ